MDFALPELGEGIYEAELIRWLVKPGDSVRRGQALLEVMTDKATMEVPAPFAGKVTYITGEPGAKLKVGQIVLAYQPDSSVVPAPEPAPVDAVKSPAEAVAVVAAKSTENGSNHRNGGSLAVAAPSVRHLARKLGIDLGKVHGSGPGGRVLIDDLTPHLARPAEKQSASSSPRQHEFGKPGTRIKLHGLRRIIAEHLVEAKRRIPHYSYVDECDVTDLVRLRTGLREPCAKIGVKLTYLPFFVKAVALALAEVPLVNSSLDEASEEIVLHDRYNVGVAVATPTGLIVPVVKDAHKRDIFTIAREIDRLAREAKSGRTKRDDIKGGCFTVSSVGNVGGLISTPIINHPEVGILGLGKVIRRPVYDEQGNIRPADQIYLSFSFDHRVVDGAVGATFGNAVKRHIETPAALLVPSE